MTTQEWEQELTDACDWVQCDHRAPLMDRLEHGPGSAAKAMRAQARMLFDTRYKGLWDCIAVAWNIEAQVREQAMIDHFVLMKLTLGKVIEDLQFDKGRQRYLLTSEQVEELEIALRGGQAHGPEAE